METSGIKKIIPITQIINIIWTEEQQPIKVDSNFASSFKIAKEFGIEFELYLEEKLIGTSKDGELVCSPANPNLTSYGEVWCTVSTDTKGGRYNTYVNAVQPERNAGMRILKDAKIKLVLPDNDIAICTDPCPIQLYVESYNVWETTSTIPFGLVGRWCFMPTHEK